MIPGYDVMYGASSSASIIANMIVPGPVRPGLLQYDFFMDLRLNGPRSFVSGEGSIAGLSVGGGEGQGPSYRTGFIPIMFGQPFQATITGHSSRTRYDLQLFIRAIDEATGDVGQEIKLYDPVTGQTVPEPATFLLSGPGVAGLLFLRRSQVS